MNRKPRGDLSGTLRKVEGKHCVFNKRCFPNIFSQTYPSNIPYFPSPEFRSCNIPWTNHLNPMNFVGENHHFRCLLPRLAVLRVRMLHRWNSKRTVFSPARVGGQVDVAFGAPGAAVKSQNLLEIGTKLSERSPETLFCHSFWHTIWKYIYIWHDFWHSIWHSFWHSIWHLSCHNFLAGILSDILSGIWLRSGIAHCDLALAV